MEEIDLDTIEDYYAERVVDLVVRKHRLIIILQLIEVEITMDFMVALLDSRAVDTI